MIIYFSGTGNSRYIASGMAEKLDDKLVDAGVYIKNRKKGKFYSDKPWIFVAPTYCWRLPRIFEKFIRKSVFSGSETAYFVMTCGEEIGNAGEGILSLCRNKGFDYKGVLEVKMPENYIALFNVPEQKKLSGKVSDGFRMARPFRSKKPGGWIGGKAVLSMTFIINSSLRQSRFMRRMPVFPVANVQKAVH